MSGFTTTGGTVFVGLEHLPEGILLWRSMTQWFGGIGIVVVAMAFLPELRVGGMQIFRSEAFDTMGKVLPRAGEIAARISAIYVVLTIACGFAYYMAGMTAFDALNHTLTTVSTGGFSTYDASMGAYQGAPEYVAALFMVLGSLPFVRYVQLVAGSSGPLFHDVQVRAFLWVIAVTTVVMTLYRILLNGDMVEPAFREALFNVISIITGTGYASVDYQLWGSFPVVLFFFLGLIGGCAGSTCCSVKIFRYQIVLSAIAVQIRKIHSPNGVFVPRFDGRPVPEDVLVLRHGVLRRLYPLARHHGRSPRHDGARHRHLDFGRGDRHRQRGAGARADHRPGGKLRRAQRHGQVDPDRRHADRSARGHGGARAFHRRVLA